MWIRCYVFIILLLSGCIEANDQGNTQFPETLSICGVSWPPFTHSDKKGSLAKGISIDIYTEAFRRLNIKPYFIEIPWIRCERGVQTGEFQAIIDNASLPDYTHPSTPTSFYPLVAYVKNASQLKQFSWKQMEKLTVGKVRGYDYTAAISAYSKWNIIEANSEEQLVSLLEGGRVDIAILDYFYGPILVKEKGSRIRALEPVMDSTPLYLDFNLKFESLAVALDKVLQELLIEGFLDDVYARYLGESYSAIKQKSSL
jgi:polar amino acid transport system substrate-binding protein